jgi:hypothetical protein
MDQGLPVRVSAPEKHELNLSPPAQTFSECEFSTIVIRLPFLDPNSEAA